MIASAVSGDPGLVGIGEERERERVLLRLAGAWGCGCMGKDDGEERQESQQFYSLAGG